MAYMVMKLIETKGAQMLCLEPRGVAGYVPVYKTKAKAMKVAGDKYPIFQIEEVK